MALRGFWQRMLLKSARGVRAILNLLSIRSKTLSQTLHGTSVGLPRKSQGWLTWGQCMHMPVPDVSCLGLVVIVQKLRLAHGLGTLDLSPWQAPGALPRVAPVVQQRLPKPVTEPSQSQRSGEGKEW